MRIGIVGAGEIGGTLAQLFVGVGHQVLLANSRGPESLVEQVAAIGGLATAVTLEDAVRHSDLVVLAIPFNRYLGLPVEPFAGRIVVDAGNYDIARDGHVESLDRHETTSGQLLAAHLPGASVIKAFNTIWYRRLLEEGRPDRPATERLAIPVAGDDPAAKEMIVALVDQLGFAPVDTGSLADSRKQEYGTPVFNNPVGPEEAQALLRLVD